MRSNTIGEAGEIKINFAFVGLGYAQSETTTTVSCQILLFYAVPEREFVEKRRNVNVNECCKWLFFKNLLKGMAEGPIYRPAVEAAPVKWSISRILERRARNDSSLRWRGRGRSMGRICSMRAGRGVMITTRSAM